MIYRVAAYITAYEDPESVGNCITAIREQSYPVEKIFIVDNSFKCPIDVSKYGNSDIIVEFFPENVGLAKGLQLGVNWAIREKYDFIWTFDQDSIPNFDNLENLLLNYQKLSEEGYSIGIIAPLPIDAYSHIEINGAIFSQYKFTSAETELHTNKDYYECDIVITSGSLVALDAAKEVELPNQNLFIDSVDLVYCMNFKSKGYSVILLKNVFLKHNFGNYVTVKSFFKRKEVLFNSYSALRYYYMHRNHSFVETRLAKGLYIAVSFLYRLKILFKDILRILIYEEKLSFLKAWASILGTFDGFRGKLGKTWQ